ncbi:MAG TPA: ATP-binding protein, partial [Negativicutes bacterium]|nr:ATP-binding protein [Negativicutes bacterium]
RLIGIQFGNISGQLFSANDEMLRIIGYTNEDLNSNQLRWDALTPEEFLKLDKDAIEQALQIGSCEPYEKQYIRKDGSLIWVLLKFVVINKEAGDTIAFVLDITEKKRAEQQYREYEDLLRLVGKIGKIGGWEFDVVTGEGTWTDEVAYIHDLDPNDSTNREIGLTFYTPESKKIIEAAIQEAIEQGKPYDLELELISAKGIHKLVRTSGQPQIVDGKVVRLRGIFHDITELKRAEEEVRKLNEELEQRVKERTAELTAANQELEAFSYSVSHDLRAPIRAIDGFSQILMDDYRDSLVPETLRYLQIIRRNTHAMGQLVDDLLAFSKLGRQSVQKQHIKMGKLVKEVVGEVKQEIQGREVEFRIEHLVDGWGDENLLRQAFYNLIANAVKFSRIRTHALIEIGTTMCEPYLSDGSHAEMRQCYYVRDNGVGFDMRYYDKLFNVFQRLHKAEEFEGTGVGLAIVKRVVEKHGGIVWAESVLDSGTTFYFTLGEEKPNDQSN